MSHPSLEPPSRKDIEAQLARLLASDSFSGASRSQGFLRFIVGEALASREDQLGGYKIGLAVFGRPEGFDPQTDPIVRVEAGRLRRRLEHHYLTDGVEDPVVIEVPKGGYVPSLSYRSGIDAPPKPSGAGLDGELEEALSPRRRLAVGALGLVLLFVLGLGAWRLLRPSQPVESISGSEATYRPISVVVLPFDYATDVDRHPFLDNGMVEELIDSLAALPAAEVVALGSAKRVVADQLTPREIARSLGVDYVIRGDVRQEQTRLRITVSVIEASTSRIRQSKNYDAKLENILDLQVEIARDVASSLAVTRTADFERRLRTSGERSSEVLALYHQATQLRDPPSDPVRSRLAEEAYRRVIELDPEFAGGHAGLAYVLGLRSWWGLSERPQADSREALQSARLAVEKDPVFGWAQMSLSIALNVAGDHDGSLSAALRAPLLSPSDPYVLAFAGIFQAFAGEVDAAIPLVRSAIRRDPLSVRTPVRNVAGVVLFHAGRFEEALGILEENVRLGGPDGPHMAYYRAGSLARLGRVEEARRELEKVSDFPYELDIQNFLSGFREPREARELWDSLESVGFVPEAVAVARAP